MRKKMPWKMSMKNSAYSHTASTYSLYEHIYIISQACNKPPFRDSTPLLLFKKKISAGRPINVSKKRPRRQPTLILKWSTL